MVGQELGRFNAGGVDLGKVETKHIHEVQSGVAKPIDLHLDIGKGGIVIRVLVIPDIHQGVIIDNLSEDAWLLSIPE